MSRRMETGFPQPGRVKCLRSRPSGNGDPVASMGAITTRKGHRGRGLCGIAAGVLLFGLAQGAAAQRASTVVEPAPRTAIVTFEESRNTNILYFQESAGMLSGTASPREAREGRTAAKAPAAPAPAAAEKTASADARRAAKRRASASDVMAARP